MIVTVRILTAGNNQAGAFTKVGVRGLFDRIQVNSSGYPVEDTQHHPQLLALLEDVRDKPEDRQGYRSMALGLDPANRSRGGTITASDVATPHTQAVTFCIPLLGMFWNSTKMIPVHAITDLAYRLTLADGPNGVVTLAAQADGSVTGFQVEGMKLMACYVEVSPQSRSMLISKTGTSWSSPIWTVLRDNLDGGVAVATSKIPDAKSSVKTLCTSFRHGHVTDPNNHNGALVDSTSRLHPNIRDFQHSVNGILTHGNSSTITAASWAAQAPSGTYSDTYFISQGFEGHGKSNSQFTGVSTLAMNPMVKVNFNAAVPAGGYDVFHYAHADARYSIENGVVRISY
eukprot:g4425.t1